jgi:hypothetical protein
MKYTLGQAAKATGKSKPTIQRAYEKGTISGLKHPNGSYEFDPAEIHRVFPAVSSASNDTPVSLPSETPIADNALQVEVKLLREMLEDARTDRDAWKEQAERATRLLAAPVRQDAPKRRWWHFGSTNDQTPPTASKTARDGGSD